MNSPVKPIIEEIKFIGKSGFDFIELTMDAPLTAKKLLRNKKEVLKVLKSHKLGIVGHAPSYVLTADISEGIRKVSQKEVLDSLDLANDFGIKKFVVHPSYISGLGVYRRKQMEKIGYDFLAKVYEKAIEFGITLCLENMGPQARWLFKPEEFKPILNDFKELKIIIDTGHANLTGRNTCLEFIKMFGKRIGHFHAADNLGYKDDHLPIGCGIIDFEKIFSALKKTGYDDTITLEVFTKDKDYVVFSLKKAKELWKKS